ncbi:MAG: T9SS type A sorting domain-containing protein [Bacteroidetes bacterium]|nr:T9SS type A sorting domain-containing protein [Bacteroidota bacterium]
MKKIASLLFACLIALAAHAQLTVQNVYVLNEGYYDWNTSTIVTAPSAGYYNPITKNYTTFATFANAQFASDLIIEGNVIYIAASDGIYRFDKTNHTQTHFTPIDGIRKMDVWNNQLLCTRGDVGLANNYFQVYDKNNLAFIYELNNMTGPAFTCEGIAVKNDKAYIALNNAFFFPNYVGKIGVVDLNLQSYVNEIDLGPDGLNPDYLALDQTNNQIVTLNNLDFTNASVSSLDLVNQMPQTTKLNVSSGCASSVFSPTQGEIAYQVMGENSIKKFDLSQQSTTTTLSVNRSIYGMAFDKVNNYLYSGNTDFVNYGQVYIYDYATGGMIDSFFVSVSPGTIVIDYTGAISINESVENSYSLFPNPASDVIKINGITNNVTVSVCDVTGKNLITKKLNEQDPFISIAHLAPGIYTVSIENKNASVFRFTKQ